MKSIHTRTYIQFDIFLTVPKLSTSSRKDILCVKDLHGICENLNYSRALCGQDSQQVDHPFKMLQFNSKLKKYWDERHRFAAQEIFEDFSGMRVYVERVRACVCLCVWVCLVQFSLPSRPEWLTLPGPTNIWTPSAPISSSLAPPGITALFVPQPQDKLKPAFQKALSWVIKKVVSLVLGLEGRFA